MSSPGAQPFSAEPAVAPLERLLADAVGLHQAGQAARAEPLYRAILASSSIQAVAGYSLGLLCHAQGRLQEAAVAYRQAIAIRHDFVDAYINLGTTVLALGHSDEAVTLYREAIAIAPGNAMAHGNLGKALQDLGRLGEAVAAYREAIALQPDNAVAHANLGAALLELEAWEDSATASRAAIALQPGHAMAHANLGAALLNLGRHDAALAACHASLALEPHHPVVQASLGGALLELGEPEAAMRACCLAIALDPDLAIAHYNLSHSLKAVNRLEESAAAVRRAIALRPDAAEYHFHLAHVLLLQGDLQAGWEEYEWRWKLEDFAWMRRFRDEFAQPRWEGEDIGDKTILVHAEQGLGDIIQFARYLPMLARRAGKVILAASPAVRRLLEPMRAITIVPLGERALPPFDVHCPLLSLPRVFGTTLDTIPASVPYLRADPVERARWRRRIGDDRLRVGIVWAGNPATRRDRVRSPGLASVAPLFAVPGVTFVALQVGPGRDDRAATGLPRHVLDLGDEITDLVDTAAIMANLDLMISSCTAPLHLAGALGVPTWAMIPYAPHFPWLLEREDTRWYPSVRLYRQDRPGRDWSAVVGRVAVDLAALVRSEGAPRCATPLDSYDAVPVDEKVQERALGRFCERVRESQPA